MKNWGTLLWSCMPTKKQIADPDPRIKWHHYKTHEDTIKANPGLTVQFHTEAPNDF